MWLILDQLMTAPAERARIESATNYLSLRRLARQAREVVPPERVARPGRPAVCRAHPARLALLLEQRQAAGQAGRDYPGSWVEGAAVRDDPAS